MAVESNIRGRIANSPGVKVANMDGIAETIQATTEEFSKMVEQKQGLQDGLQYNRNVTDAKLMFLNLSQEINRDVNLEDGTISGLPLSDYVRTKMNNYLSGTKINSKYAGKFKETVENYANETILNSQVALLERQKNEDIKRIDQNMDQAYSQIASTMIDERVTAQEAMKMITDVGAALPKDLMYDYHDKRFFEEKSQEHYNKMVSMVGPQLLATNQRGKYLDLYGLRDVVATIGKSNPAALKALFNNPGNDSYEVMSIDGKLSVINKNAVKALSEKMGMNVATMKDGSHLNLEGKVNGEKVKLQLKNGVLSVANPGKLSEESIDKVNVMLDSIAASYGGSEGVIPFTIGDDIKVKNNFASKVPMKEKASALTNFMTALQRDSEFSNFSFSNALTALYHNANLTPQNIRDISNQVDQYLYSIRPTLQPAQRVSRDNDAFEVVFASIARRMSGGIAEKSTQELEALREDFLNSSYLNPEIKKLAKELGQDTSSSIWASTVQMKAVRAIDNAIAADAEERKRLGTVQYLAKHNDNVKSILDSYNNALTNYSQVGDINSPNLTLNQLRNQLDYTIANAANRAGLVHTYLYEPQDENKLRDAMFTLSSSTSNPDLKARALGEVSRLYYKDPQRFDRFLADAGNKFPKELGILVGVAQFEGVHQPQNRDYVDRILRLVSDASTLTAGMNSFKAGYSGLKKEVMRALMEGNNGGEFQAMRSIGYDEKAIAGIVEVLTLAAANDLLSQSKGKINFDPNMSSVLSDTKITGFYNTLKQDLNITNIVKGSKGPSDYFRTTYSNFDDYHRKYAEQLSDVSQNYSNTIGKYIQIADYNQLAKIPAIRDVLDATWNSVYPAKGGIQEIRDYEKLKDVSMFNSEVRRKFYSELKERFEDISKQGYKVIYKSDRSPIGEKNNLRMAFQHESGNNVNVLTETDRGFPVKLLLDLRGDPEREW